jgi:diguanylate cyclase (GGDEF)-like protein
MKMSFRGRLRVFFALIVIVPMAALAFALFSITEDSERGKADATIATSLNVALSVYGEGRREARGDLRRVAADDGLIAALTAGDDRAAGARLRHLVAGDADLVSATMRTADGHLIRVGAADGVAGAGARLTRANGRRVGALAVSTTRGRELTRVVRRRTGIDIVALRSGRPVASTLRGLTRVPEGSGDFSAGGRDFRGRRQRAGRVVGVNEDLAAITDATRLNSSIASSRLLIGAILAAVLILALATSVFVMRGLQGQVAEFLAAARRVAGGRFDQTVPAEGNDEFAALGREFNAMSDHLEQMIEQVQRKNRDLEQTIRRVGKAFAGGLDRQAVIELTAQTALDACEAEQGHAVPLDLRVFESYIVGDRDDELAEALTKAERAALAISPDTGRELLESHDPDEVQVPQRDPVMEAHGEIHAIAQVLRARLGARTSVQFIGVISVARRGRPFDDREAELLEYLAGQAVISIENADLHDTIQRQAVTDELTGLSNVRELHGALDREFERGSRFATPVSLVLVDIDDFKQVNDSHGHQQGDEVLIEVARIVQELTRDVDQAARYGGEELAVVLAQTDIVGAEQLAERMREAVADLSLPLIGGDDHVGVTASFGVASAPGSAYDKKSLIAAADAALYRAKRAGKNRVERAQPVAAESSTRPSGR